MGDVIKIEAFDGVPKLYLKFKPKSIAKIEKETGKSILDGIDIDIASVVRFIQAGNNDCDEDKAYDILGDWLENGGNMLIVNMHILKALEDGGFLARDLGMSKRAEIQLRKMMKEAAEELEQELLEEESTNFEL